MLPVIIFSFVFLVFVIIKSGLIVFPIVGVAGRFGVLVTQVGVEIGEVAGIGCRMTVVMEDILLIAVREDVFVVPILAGGTDTAGRRPAHFDHGELSGGLNHHVILGILMHGELDQLKNALSIHV